MQSKKSFFGATNGYSGFKSNFERIFGYPEVEKLFIIKGGPGTGKSTLMRKIEERYSNRFDTTIILCSSDPGSLDGVIISGNGRSVGIVDGTSPHVVEPKYPGAVEELINLSEGFDIHSLEGMKNEITTASNEKKNHYARAYTALGLSGQIHNYIKENILNKECYSEAERMTGGIIAEERGGANLHIKSDFLTGSFSKSGYTCVNNLDYGKRVVTVANDGIIGYLVMAKIVDMLKERSVDFTTFPSAFSSDLTDLIETDRTVYSLSNAHDCDIDSLSLKQYIDGYDECKATYDYYIESARRSLSLASEYHLILESIYTSAIDFTQNDRKYEQAAKAIDEVFDK